LIQKESKKKVGLYMPIPDYQSIMKPLLELISDGQEYYMRDIYEILASKFKLNEVEKKELLPSGKQPIFENRVGWARTYMKKAGLIETTRRGYIRISTRGLEVIQKKPEVINDKFLEQFPEFVEFQSRKPKEEKIINESSVKKTPQELIEEGYQGIRQNLSQELLELIKAVSPKFFENLVVDLLVQMGYGGSFKDAQEVVGRSHDGGIDGIIKEDRLGLDTIYIQAKRWESTTVGSGDIQKFVGALTAKGASKGVFITTSSFSPEAKKFAEQIATTKKVVLIDGEQLAELMIDHSVGVSQINCYEIKRIDTDYFEEA
jgi:restriction system protein